MLASYSKRLLDAARNASDEELERKMHRLPQTILENAMWHLAMADHGRGMQWRDAARRRAFLILYHLHNLVLEMHSY
jgi:hypothetical protein